MPLPKPHKGEKESDFISRCMGNDVMKDEYSGQKQRAAVCYSQWKSVHGKAETEAQFMDTLKVTLTGRKPADVLSVVTPMEVQNVTRMDIGGDGQIVISNAAENDPFAKLDMKPDHWKAYMDFDIVHTLPSVSGPVQEGFYTAFLPGTAAESHASLLHQQMNLNHLLKEYSTENKEIANDRIVGCVVATWFPPKPMDGWKIGSDASKAPAIRARAVIFKLAHGVNRIFGDHQTSRQKQSVSIESITSLENLGVYVPSRGADKIVPLLEADKDTELMAALSFNPLKLATINGEQPAFVFGIRSPVDFRGVGITPRPAEREAKIISFQAQRSQTSDGGTLVAMAASQIDQELMSRKVTFRSGRVGVIDKVWSEGEARLKDCFWHIAATAENPVVQVKLTDRAHVLYRMNDLAGAISD